MRFALLTLALLLSACGTEPDTETYEVFPVAVSLISADTDSVWVFVSMSIGPNLCYRYERAEFRMIADTQIVSFIARRPTPDSPVLCLQQLSSISDTLVIQRVAGTSAMMFSLESGRDTVIFVDN